MRILVAEDHPALAKSVAGGLREEGYAVDLTYRGDDALLMARMHPYDCIVLDLMLPVVDGWTVVSTLRHLGSHSPIICLTARDASEDRVRGLNLGADDYLIKPFVWDELLARVRALIRRRHSVKSPVIKIADLEIDSAAKTVRRGNGAIKLSGREFSLLEYLALRQGQVLSRADIASHVYDTSDAVSSNVIDVYIAYLRNKIDRDYSPKLIHTRHGQGYVLMEPVE